MKKYLVNKSRQRVDVLLKRDGKETPVALVSGKRLPFNKKEMTPALETMLANPRAFGIHLIEEEAPKAKAEEKEVD